MAWLCRQLGVARSGYYAWRHRQEAPGQRAAENAVITAEIQAVFHGHRGFYGSPRIHQEARAAGHPVGRHRVAQLMQRAELKARTRKAFRPCSRDRSGAAGVVENLQQQLQHVREGLQLGQRRGGEPFLHPVAEGFCEAVARTRSR
ncbi:IS3 family transposase [Synechococcus sp. CCY9201]|uniref:IS3 family transposase n=1 Tax=Synechococcus sp. CCY9201 TaxID=174697 RepID=UPI002B204750|nr:IS3 family transposase [Synechococcus sp. CCY9201]